MSSGQALRQMYLEGQQKWPLLKLERDLFERHCRQALGPDPEPDAQQYGSDLYLCCACATRNSEALLAFERQGSDMARAAIARVHRDPEFVQETLRDLWDKLLYGEEPKVTEYSCRGPLNAWVRVVATRTALDRCRTERLAGARQIRLSEHFVEEGSGPESSLTKARYTATFQHALERAFGALSTQDRNLLRMHVLGRCSIDQIGRAYRVHRATAARWLERARTQIFESVRQQLALAHADLTDSEFNSIARAMGNELELKMTRDSAELTWGSQHPER